MVPNEFFLFYILCTLYMCIGSSVAIAVSVASVSSTSPYLFPGQKDKTVQGPLFYLGFSGNQGPNPVFHDTFS